MLAEQGQITDRFTKAVEQLGSEKLDVRIGGIYALERVARDSIHDHPTVIEVLCAFVRTHSREPRDPGAEKSVRPDIQAALTVIGRRKSDRDVGTLELHSAKLANAYLVDADLVGANLIHADLTEVVLQNADLTDAILTGATLSHCDLINANLTRAYLADALINDAVMLGANFTSAMLHDCDLTNAEFADDGHMGKVFGDADLSNAVFKGANLTGAHWPTAAVLPEGWARDQRSGLLNRADGEGPEAPHE
jgi:uncharacterized protein YjbI with pentapeptide repeats